LPKDMVFFTQDHHGGRAKMASTSTLCAGPILRARWWGRKRLNARRAQGSLQGLELLRRGACEAVADVQEARRSCARFVHLRLPTDKPATFDATVEMALKAGVTFAQFVMMTPFPGTVTLRGWEKEQAVHPTLVAGVPITRTGLIPTESAPRCLHRIPR